METYSDSNYAGDHVDRISTSAFCTYLGDNLVTWQSHKQRVVFLLSVKVQHRAMTQASSEMLWVLSLLTELGFLVSSPMPMFCDNQANFFIVSNPTFH